MFEQMGNKYLNWGLYCVVLGALALKANIVTVMLFIIITFVCSLKKPVFSICSFQCALVANSYLGDFYYLNLALCGIVIVSFIYYAKGFRFLDKRDVPLIMAFIYSMILSVVNGFDNILVVTVFMLIVVIARLMCRCDIISLKEIIVSMAITSCFSGVVGLMSDAYGLSYGAGSVSRFLSSYGDPNFFCMFSVAAIVGLVYFKASKLKVVAIFVLAIFCVLTFSKSMLVLAALNIIIFLGKSTIDVKNKIKWIVLTVVGIIALNWVVENLYDQNILVNYMFRFTQESTGTSGISSLTTGRSEVQKAFLNYYFNSQSIVKMLFGNGYIGTRNIAHAIGLTVDTTHMVYLQILMDFGIIGSLLYLYVFIRGFVDAGMIQKHMLITYFFAMFSLSWQFTIPYFGFYLLLSNNKALKIDDEEVYKNGEEDSLLSCN